MDGSVDNLMNNQKAGCPQVAAQAAHSLPTTVFLITTTTCFDQKKSLTIGSALVLKADSLFATKPDKSICC
jgi:hypothetical protein